MAAESALPAALMAAAVSAAVRGGASTRQLNAIVYGIVRGCTVRDDDGAVPFGDGGIEVFERAMGAARQGTHPDASISEVVRGLRGAGQERLASRLRKASSKRNRCAHPDYGLADDLEKFFDTASNASTMAAEEPPLASDGGGDSGDGAAIGEELSIGARVQHEVQYHGAPGGAGEWHVLPRGPSETSRGEVYAGTDTIEEEQTARVLLKVVDQLGGVTQFRVKHTVPLRKRMSAYCTPLGLQASQVVFWVNGVRLFPDDTAEAFGLEDGDFIEARDADTLKNPGNP